MYVIERAHNLRHLVKIKQLEDNDYKVLTKKRFYFNWKTEKTNVVYKLVLGNEIMGVMSCRYHEDERIEIVLLAVSKENRGANKKYDRIAGNLIAFSCREAVKRYGINGCVSLVPKTALRQHYCDMYGMESSGFQLFLAGLSLLNMLREYGL